MTDVRDSREGHQCFGCRKQLADGEPHIHIPLDDWSSRQGLSTFGLDDLLTFAFCEPCTTPAKNGWHIEAHDTASLPPYVPAEDPRDA